MNVPPQLALSYASSPASPLSIRTLRPEECPPCFDCHLSGFPCVHFANCSDVNGKCVCPPGFGGDDCSVPLCDSLADGDQRHQIPAGQQYCECDDGWFGNNCNVCSKDNVCSQMIIGDLPGVCYKSSMAVRQNFMQCQVTNEGVVKNLKKSAEVTFTCDSWYGESDIESSSNRPLEQLPAKNISTYSCDKMSCRCLPNRTLCGEAGSIDLSDWMTDDEEGPTGPMTYTCVEAPNDNSNHSCKFEEPHMNSLISLISKEDYFSLACVAGECLHVTQIPGYTPPTPGTAFTPFMIGLMMVVGLGIVAMVLISITWFQTRSERSQFQTSHFRVAEDGDEEMEEMHRRAMMSGHTPCSLMFSDLGYAIDTKAKTTQSNSQVAANGNADGNAATSNEGENVPLLSDDAADASSVFGDEASRLRSKFVVLEGVSGCVRPGEVMAIMGGSGAGKSTLLDILGKRNKSGIISGQILVNGKTMSHDEYRSIIGYVDQEDTLMDTLTVYETIMYSALLRLPRTMSYESKKMRVEETMMELDIVHIANRRIGKAGSRGISGGEKRRVSIACELVTSPSILLLDEPTSGLDSYNAYNVIECLVSLARNYQRTVLFTIHQPRSNIYALFDHLVLLAKGRLVYSGPAQQQAIDHFSALGFNCPIGFNIADYLVDLTMHAIGSSGTPMNPNDALNAVIAPTEVEESLGESGEPPRATPFLRRRRSSIRVQQEELLFTPRPPVNPSAIEILPLKDSSPSHGSLGIPIATSRDPLSDEEDDDLRFSRDFVSGSAPSSGLLLRAAETLPGPGAADSRGSLPNNGSGSRLPSSTSLDNFHKTPLRGTVGKRRRNLNGLFSTSPGGTGSSSAGGRPLSTASDISNSGGDLGLTFGSSTMAEPTLTDGNHLNVLVNGYNHSPMAALVKTEIAASIAAAEVPTASIGPNGHRRGRSFSSMASFRESIAESTTLNRIWGNLNGAIAENRPTAWTQFKILSGRTFKNLYRNPDLLRTHYVFAAERLIFVRERANRYYQPITYYTSKVLFDMFPLRVIPPIILGLICYHMIGLRAEDVWFLLRFLLVLILFNLTAASCCMMISIVFKDSGMASLIATLVMLFEMLFGGLLLNKGTVPAYATWLQTFSFFNCALEALVVNEVNGLTLFETKFGLKIDVPGAVILQTFGFNAKNYWSDVQRLVIMFFSFLTIGFLWLQFMHVYLPRYMDLMRSRTTVPRVFKNNHGQERLIILPQEDLDASTRTGRPVGPEYYDMRVKLEFMDKHDIDVSVVSLANPWLDFLPAKESETYATELNNDLDALCQSFKGRLFGFGVLPTGSSSVSSWVDEIRKISKLSSLRGAIIGTRGLGKGLDDLELEPFFKEAAEKNMMLFVHPHYGINPELYGEKPNGHVLPLALGFPFETTIAVSRLILSGMLDRVPNLKLLLAHSGGTLPFLSGRLDSCVQHDPHVASRLAHPPSSYLKRFYYDAVSYHPAALNCAAELVGADRLMFGTDNPFFPPLEGGGRWESVDSNLRAIGRAFVERVGEGVLGGNAVEVLNLK
ncbi:hypothetical protein HDU67_004012 [Dinochytrium kinnereticum]|nr:hypothetical protein HDU67_004012 [Dinochytrium kinnereticum]